MKRYFKKKSWINFIGHSMDNKFIIKMHRQNWDFLYKESLSS